MLDPRFVYLAGVITLIGSFVYAVGTFRGKTRPNRVTWILWTVIPLITFFAQLSKGVGLPAVFALAYALGPLFVVIASFANKKAYWRLTGFDYLCGAISILAIALWIITGDGTTAIILSVVADFAAGLPTIRKSYLDPKSENIVVYSLGIVSAVLALLTIQTLTVANALFPIYILCNNILIYLMIKVFSKYAPKGRGVGARKAASSGRR